MNSKSLNVFMIKCQTILGSVLSSNIMGGF